MIDRRQLLREQRSVAHRGDDDAEADAHRLMTSGNPGEGSRRLKHPSVLLGLWPLWNHQVVGGVAARPPEPCRGAGCGVEVLRADSRTDRRKDDAELHLVSPRGANLGMPSSNTTETGMPTCTSSGGQ